MRELTFNEVEEVSGGLLPPIVVAGLWFSGGTLAGFGVGAFLGWSTSTLS